MTYRITPRYLSSRQVMVVGVGGTGSFVADGLCRLLDNNIDIILVDHDRVESHNLGRQLFYQEDLGRFKSQALAERLARLYRRKIGYSVHPFMAGRDAIGQEAGLIIGCVDNAAGRNVIHTTSNAWWLDAGNACNSGQVLIGNIRQKDGCKETFDLTQQVCYGLPSPALQMPELLLPGPDGGKPRDCAQRVESEEQSPVINQFMAGLALEMVRRFLRAELTWMGIMADLDLGIFSPLEAEPEAVARITGLRVNQVIAERR